VSERLTVVRLKPLYRIRFTYPEGWAVGRTYPAGRRRVVGAVFHSSDCERYQRLNDAVCVSVGEVRAAGGASPELVVDIAELVWEELPE
jgi:hypothetical protein